MCVQLEQVLDDDCSASSTYCPELGKEDNIELDLYCIVFAFVLEFNTGTYNYYDDLLRNL